MQVVGAQAPPVAGQEVEACQRVGHGPPSMRAPSGRRPPSISKARWRAARTAPSSLRRNTGAAVPGTRRDVRLEPDAALAQSRVRQAAQFQLHINTDIVPLAGLGPIRPGVC